MTRAQIVFLLVAAAVLLAVTFIVDADAIDPWEEDLTVWINEAPRWLALALWPVMQLGSLFGPFIVGVVAAIVWGWKRGLAVVVAGVVAWYLAKVVKEIVERGRPLRYIPDIDVVEGDGTGLGFVSGHTAVAFAVATTLFPVLPRWGRVVAFGMATVVGLARIIYGAHLPLDVLGGACLGIIVGCVVDLVLQGISSRRDLRTLGRRPGRTPE